MLAAETYSLLVWRDGCVSSVPALATVSISQPPSIAPQQDVYKRQEYTLPRNLQLLKKRNLGQKRSMAAREFALGVEGLERFVRKEPLRRVHECIFGVLAMETEGVDPRL